VKWLLVGVVVLAAVVCAIVFWPASDRIPSIAYGRDTCARCRMILSQPGFAAIARDSQGHWQKYDDLGCARAAAPNGEILVEDHKDDRWVPLAKATLVEGVPTPMGFNVVAFGSPEAARAFTAAHPPAAKLTDADARAGKAVYVRECSACHGERGDGKGPAASFLDPRPRDFTKKMFKIRSTESGQPPTVADLLRTVERGLPGSAMPAFSFLTVEERRQAVAYVMDKADLLDADAPRPIADPGAPPPADAASITRGKAIYEQMQCAACHGASGRGDGPAASGLKDDDGRAIPVRDFTGGVFRGGSERADLYYRFVTGMDGSPMPAFGDQVKGADRWALVDYVMSLRVPPPPVPRPSNPIAAGREVVARFGCRGCHVLDDGTGGDVGPDLRISGQKLSSEWLRAFLKSPREAGKIYPWRPHRMPKLALTDEEIDTLVAYVGAMGKRKPGPATLPDEAQLAKANLDQGKNLFVLRCTECHSLGKVIETPLAKQQGPDLIHVAGRVDFDWAKRWISDPKKVDPKTKMTVPGITPAQVDDVRAFVWKNSMGASEKPLAAGSGSAGGL
jgi:mono/diheme cytochrome c family protein